MTAILTFLILMAPLVVALVLGWAAHRSSALRWGLHQFPVSAPMRGRLSGADSDIPRMEHEIDAIRTRFEKQPVWPASGALGERR
jgi:hypothetical protein